ncbi:hypothetical protein [Limnohabitans sp.]|uniref:hypothetical protein n=1 Tax=Limnohabitans sp. TaxID=1907725 RepID=UPI0035B4ACF8
MPGGRGIRPGAGAGARIRAMQWMAFPPDSSAAQRARVASLHAGQQQRRFGANSLDKHAPPAACVR